jgi:hypothetical protein
MVNITVNSGAAIARSGGKQMGVQDNIHRR